MKSRPDILEELDIKCWQFVRCRSPLSYSTGGNITIMVKDMRLIFVIVLFLATIVVQKSLAFEKTIKKQIYNNDGLGTYSFEYEISDGSYRKEDGGIILNSEGLKSLVVRGEYGYIDPYGQPHSVKYVADSNGYRPQAVDTDTRFNDRRIV